MPTIIKTAQGSTSDQNSQRNSVYFGDSVRRIESFDESAPSSSCLDGLRRRVRKIRENDNAFFIIPRDGRFAHFLAGVLLSSWFEHLSLVAVFLNCIWIVAFDIFNPNFMFYLGELIFVSYYFFETLVRIVGLGLIFHKDAFLRDWWNWYDSVVIALNAFSLFSDSFKFLRILPPFRLFARVPEMRIIVGSLILAIPRLVSTVIVFVAIVFFFSILGVNLFSGILHQRCFDSISGDLMTDVLCSNLDSGGFHCPSSQFCADSGISNPSGQWSGFDSVPIGAMSVLQFITLDNWSENMYQIGAAFNEPVSIVFFLLLIIFGTFTVANLLLAVITESYTDLSAQERQRLKDQMWERRMFFFSRSRQARDLEAVKKNMRRKIAAEMVLERLAKLSNRNLKTLVTPPPDAVTATSGDEGLSGIDSTANLSGTDVEARKKRRKKKKRADGTRKRKSHKSSSKKQPPAPPLTFQDRVDKIRLIIASALSTSQFEGLLVMVILANIGMLCYHHYPMPDLANTIIRFLNMFFAGFFTLEALLRCFVLGGKEYVSSPANVFDATITILSYVQFFSPEYAVISAIQAARILKLFNTSLIWSSLRSLTQQVAISVVRIAGLMFMTFITLILFSLIGNMLFGGMFDSWPIEDVPRLNFDSLFMSFLTCFAVMTGSGWTDIMHKSMDAWGPTAAAFFICLYLTSNFLLLNCFVAILLDSVSIDPPEWTKKKLGPSTWASLLFAVLCCGESQNQVVPVYSFQNGMLPLTTVTIDPSIPPLPLPLPPVPSKSKTRRPKKNQISTAVAAEQNSENTTLQNNSEAVGAKLKVDVEGRSLASLPGQIARLSPLRSAETPQDRSERTTLLHNPPSEPSSPDDSPRDQTTTPKNVHKDNSSVYKDTIGARDNAFLQSSGSAYKDIIGAGSAHGSGVYKDTLGDGSAGGVYKDSSASGSQSVYKDTSNVRVSFDSRPPTLLVSKSVELGDLKERLRMRTFLSGKPGTDPSRLLPSQKLFSSLNDPLPPVRGSGSLQKQVKNILHSKLGWSQVEAAVAIQSVIRGNIARKLVRKMKEEREKQSAEKIQKLFRGFIARKNFKIILQNYKKLLEQKRIDDEEERKRRELAEKFHVFVFHPDLCASNQAQKLVENGAKTAKISPQSALSQLPRPIIFIDKNEEVSKLPAFNPTSRLLNRVVSRDFALMTQTTHPEVISDDWDQDATRNPSEEISGVSVAHTHYPRFFIFGMFKWGRDRSCGIWTRKSRLRRSCLKIATQPWFEALMALIIILSCIPVAAYTPLHPFPPEWKEIVDWWNVAATCAYLVEVVVKIVAHGLIAHPEAHLQDPWNVVDTILVFLSLADVILVHTASIDMLFIMGAIRTLRVVRPLRLIKRIQGLKETVNALASSIPAVLDVIIITVVLFISFAAIGVHLFAGKLGSCNDASITLKDLCQGAFIDGNSLSVERQWMRSYPNFDSLSQALLAITQISTGDSWTDLMFRGIDATGTTTGPQRDFNKPASVFFILVVFLCSFFVLQLFVAVLVARFFKAKWSKTKVEAVMDTMTWIQVQRALFHSRNPFTWRQRAPKNCFRRILYKLVSHKTTEMFITICVIASIGIMATLHHDQSQYFTDLQQMGSRLFTIIFIVEMGLRIIGLGARAYFDDTWNVLDFFVVLVSALVEFLADYIPGNGGGIARLFRIARIFRLVTVSSDLRRVVSTLLATLPYLCHIGMLLFLVLFMYACIGVQTFAYVKFGENLNENANFTSFGVAVLTLFRIMTGDAWMGLMTDLSISPPMCDPSQNECGYPNFSPIFFCSFYAMSALMLLNLLAGIILENFSASMPNAKLTEVHVIKFGELWLKFDPFKCKHIHLMALPRFLHQLTHPLGALNPNSGSTLPFNITLPKRLSGLGGGGGGNGGGNGENQNGRKVIALRNVLSIMDHVPVHYDQMFVHYKDLLTALAFHAYGLDLSELPREIFINLDQGWRPQYRGDPPLPNAHKASRAWAVLVIQDAWRMYKLTQKQKAAEARAAAAAQKALPPSPVIPQEAAEEEASGVGLFGDGGTLKKSVSIDSSSMLLAGDRASTSTSTILFLSLSFFERTTVRLRELARTRRMFREVERKRNRVKKMKKFW